jgi:electron transfer flavoprotein beta subunit
MKYKRARVASELAKEVGAENLEAVKAELEARGLLITELNAAQINADPARIGFPGSPTKVKQVMSVVLTAGEAKTVEPTADGIAELIHELISDHTLG